MCDFSFKSVRVDIEIGPECVYYMYACVFSVFIFNFLSLSLVSVCVANLRTGVADWQSN